MQCMTAFIQQGYTVSIPYGDAARYDFIADKNGVLQRVQCKSATPLKDGSGFKFGVRSIRVNTRATISTPYTKADIDVFATYFDGNCYVVPVEDCGTTAKTLRITPPKHNQQAFISYAVDYLLK